MIRSVGEQAGHVVARLDGNRATPTLAIHSIQNGDHDLSSRSDVDLPYVGGVTKITKLGKRIVAWLGSRNNGDIVGALGRIPSEVRGLALGEDGGIDGESPDMESSESENEGSGEKSGVHRGYF